MSGLCGSGAALSDIVISPTDSLLAKAEPISKTGGASVKKYLRKGRK